MSKAPETIWACESASGQCVVSFSTPSEHYRIEYRRADLLDSTIGAKLMQERAADAIRKRGQGEIEVALIGPTTRAFYEAYEIILALPVPTEAEVMAAAMELPQIKALREALERIAHASDFYGVEANAEDQGAGTLAYAHKSTCNLARKTLAALVRP